MRNLYSIYPRISYVNNLGHDGSGVHCSKKEDSVYSHNEMSMKNSIDFIKEIKINKKIVKNFNNAFDIKIYDQALRIIKIIGVYPFLKKLRDKLR